MENTVGVALTGVKLYEAVVELDNQTKHLFSRYVKFKQTKKSVQLGCGF